jgi:uracil-DNA glycosylase
VRNRGADGEQRKRLAYADHDQTRRLLLGETALSGGSPTDEIYEKYLQKAISEINDLGDEIAQAAGEHAATVLGSGHPLADVLLLKYSPQESEFLEGVAFYGRAGQAILKSLQRLRVDPMAVYGTNCLKFAGAKPDERAREWLTRELHIVQPKLVVVMGEHAIEFLNSIEFPLSSPLHPGTDAIQRFTPTVEALYVPDVDESLDEQTEKTRFWNAFKSLGDWWAALPPY